MDCDCAHRIVDLHPAFDEEHRFDDDDASKGAQKCCNPRIKERTRCGDDHETGKQTIRHHGGIGLACALPDPEHRREAAEGAGECSVQCDDTNLRIAGCEGRRRVEAEPTEQKDERSEKCHRDVVTRKGTRLSVLAELANTWSKHDRTGESSDTTSSVNNTRTGEVDVAVAPVQ